VSSVDSKYLSVQIKAGYNFPTLQIGKTKVCRLFVRVAFLNNADQPLSPHADTSVELISGGDCLWNSSLRLPLTHSPASLRLRCQVHVAIGADPPPLAAAILPLPCGPDNNDRVRFAVLTPPASLEAWENRATGWRLPNGVLVHKTHKTYLLLLVLLLFFCFDT
jgi:hypothetical protein